MIAFDTLCRSKTLKFRYADIFFNFNFDEDTIFQFRLDKHVMVYIYSGSIKVEDESNHSMEGKQEECFFIEKNTSVLISCHLGNANNFSCLFMAIKQKSLSLFHYQLCPILYLSHIKRYLPRIMRLPETADIKSLFISMIPYFNWPQCPCKEIMDLKQSEAIYSLIYADKGYYFCLHRTLLSSQS